MTACTAAATLVLVSRFVGDYDHGRAAAAAAAARFAPEPAFFVKVRAAYDPARNIVNFAGKLPHGKDFNGAAACTSRGPLLIVWSM